MAQQRYNSYQYETSPRKLQPEYEPKKNPYKKKKASTVKKNTNKNEKQKKAVKEKTQILLYVLLGFAILFAISYRNSQITETFNERESLKKQLSLLEKENEQLKINIESSLNLNNVEQLAKERLGMQKLNNDQKIYVSLEKKDYIEPAIEEIIIKNEKSIWDKIAEYIKNIIK